MRTEALWAECRKRRRGSYLLAVLSFSLHANFILAQDSPARQAMINGLWEPVRGNAPSETLLDLEAEGLLTADAEAYRRNWTIEENDAGALCQRRSAAAHGGSGSTLEFFSKEGAIYLISMQQVRRVYLDERDRPVGFWPNKLGWSEGRWEANSLVVLTTDFTLGTIDSGDRPLPFGGPDAEMIERFTLSEDATRLSVEVSRTDPKYYIAPIILHQDFVRSDDTVYPTDCIPSVY